MYLTLFLFFLLEYAKPSNQLCRKACPSLYSSKFFIVVRHLTLFLFCPISFSLHSVEVFHQYPQCNKATLVSETSNIFFSFTSVSNYHFTSTPEELQISVINQSPLSNITKNPEHLFPIIFTMYDFYLNSIHIIQ